MLADRLGKGSGYKGNGKVPEKPLVYWGYESSPFCKVRRRSVPRALIRPLRDYHCGIQHVGAGFWSAVFRAGIYHGM